MSASIPSLHWVDPQNELGVRPVYWRLKNNGQQILYDEFLDPPLYWTSGALRPKGYWILCVSAYELVRNAAQIQNARVAVRTEPNFLGVEPLRMPSGCGLDAKDLLQRLPHLEWLSGGNSSDGTGYFMPALNLRIAQTDGSRIDWNLWCQRWQPEASRHSPLFAESLNDPFLLIRSSYQWICGVLEKGELGSDEFSAALTALGLGALGAFPRVECDLCFRLAVPGRLRCMHHSVSQMIQSDGDTRNIQNSAVARRVCKSLHWPMMKPFSFLTGSETNEEEVLCGLLWPLSGQQLLEQTESLKRILLKCPNVRQRLSKDTLDLDANQILAQLRSHVDQHEWNLNAWPNKLLIAEEWLAALKVVAPRRAKKMTEKNVQRFQAAKELLAQGKKKGEIAKALGVSRSNLSNILRSGETKLA